jgi:hypothetical protein
VYQDHAFIVADGAGPHGLQVFDLTRLRNVMNPPVTFTEDAHYVEHAYGELHGRDAIRDWIEKVMAPYPTMTFPQDWVAFDEEQGAVVFQCQNAFPPPFDAGGRPFSFPSWTRLVYGRAGLWASEEDVYNPARDAPRVFKAWVEAGGTPLTREQERVFRRRPGR